MKGKEKHRRMKPRLELKLNLSPPKDSGSDDDSLFSLPSSSSSSYLSSSPSGTSATSSCISSEFNSENRTVPEGNQNQTLGGFSSLEATSMVLAGCRRCLMYVMLSHADPRCPRCKNTCLLDFQQKISNKTKTF
uniref:GIR1-like zinc ribbon domain-containing protein n=1 Tax=Nymphaea colorata TaxID=210225 RepID=A0A5K0Z2G0_9MAGN